MERWRRSSPGVSLWERERIRVVGPSEFLEAAILTHGPGVVKRKSRPSLDRLIVKELHRQLRSLTCPGGRNKIRAFSINATLEDGSGDAEVLDGDAVVENVRP